MKIRTQIILAFLLLAVVPLSGIVLYSYASSLRALKRAEEAEVGALAREMDGRMAAIRSELGRGVERVGEVPYDMLAEAMREGKPEPMAGRLILGLGEAASLVDSLEFVPIPPVRVEVGTPVPAPAAPAPPAAETPPSASPMVIDVGEVLREVKAEMEAAGSDPRAAEAISQALRNLPGIPTAQPPEAPSAPGAPPGVPATAPPAEDGEARSIEIRRRIEEQLAQEAEKRKALAERLAHLERERRAGDRRLRVARRRLALGREFAVPVTERGEVVGELKAQLKSEEILRRVFGRTERRAGEVPFAMDAEGNLYTVNEQDRKRIEDLPLFSQVHEHANSARWVLGDWVVATRKDPESGLVFGIARPVPLAEVRRTAARNFGYGLGLIGLALFGILPFSGRMTRNLRRVTDGAERIAQGDLDTRLEVRSKDEFGRLALTFNRMAEDLKRHQEREIEQALLHTEYERKTRELEEARSFQLSLLPKVLPEHDAFEIAVSMQTATEVGGDYYDFHLAEDGTLTAAVGDATGHGVKAGTMVTAVKSLFSADAGVSEPRDFLAEAARAVRRMALERMAIGLCLARLHDGALTVSSAGMPPILVYHAASGEAEEIALAGMPLGGLASEYEERRLEVAVGDVILLMTDGLPELTDPNGDPLGYPRVRVLFEELGSKAPGEIIAGLTAAAESWGGGEAAKDDVTLVVIRVR